MTNADVQAVCRVGATLGEGPAWIARDQSLWFVDIKHPRLYRFHAATRTLDHWAAPAQIGWALPAADGTMIAGLQTGLHRFDPGSGSFTLIAEVEPDRPGNRLNDATVAPDGTLWFGSMDDDEQAETGHFYRLDGRTVIDSGHPPVAITNGPACSIDGRTLYTTDTLGRTIWAQAVNDDHTLGPQRVFATIEEGAGYPDGPTIDAEGCLWTGLYGGWAVRRYDPDGRLMRSVTMPVANVTKIAFGGADLRTAFATTARQGLDAAARERQPLAGDLLAFDPGVAGAALTTVR